MADDGVFDGENGWGWDSVNQTKNSTLDLDGFLDSAKNLIRVIFSIHHVSFTPLMKRIKR